MLARLLDAGAELDRLRCVLLGGGPARRGLIERALDAGVPVAPTYGLTEAASQVTTLPPGEARERPGSAGTPILPTEVRIEDGAGSWCAGPTRGARRRRGPDGWLRTGDLGRIDEDGHLYVLGRADDVIVTGGENVSPEEVEQVLLRAPGRARTRRSTGGEDPEWQRPWSRSWYPPTERRPARRSCARSAASGWPAQGAEGDSSSRRRAAAQRAGQAAARRAERWLIPLAPDGSTHHVRRLSSDADLSSSRARPWPCSATAHRATPTRST